jgi:hypothetical protein
LLDVVPLGLAKLFADQAVPAAGIGGTLLVIRGLARRGISSGLAMAVLRVGLVSFWPLRYPRRSTFTYRVAYSLIESGVPYATMHDGRRGSRGCEVDATSAEPSGIRN